MTALDATALLKTERRLRFHDLRAGPSFDAVTVWVDGAELSDRTQPAGTGNADVDRILGPVRVVQTTPGCLRYEITFADCIAYAWRNESYALPEPDEDFGTMLRRYQHSSFLDYVSAATFAADAALGPLQHVAVVTLDAILDVVCPNDPTVTATMLGPDDPGPLPGRPIETG